MCRQLKDLLHYCIRTTFCHQHSRRCKWSWLVTIIILLVVITVNSGGLSSFTACSQTRALSYWYVNFTFTHASYNYTTVSEYPWTINTIHPESTFPTDTIGFTVAGETSINHLSDLPINVDSITISTSCNLRWVFYPTCLWLLNFVCIRRELASSPEALSLTSRSMIVKNWVL